MSVYPDFTTKKYGNRPASIRYIDSLNGLPAPSGGIIKIEDDVTFALRENIINPNTIEVATGASCYFTADVPLRRALVYVGSGNMFQATDLTSLVFDGINFAMPVPGAKWISQSNAVMGGTIAFQTCFLVSGTDLGDINNLTTFFCLDSAFLNLTGGGLDFTGDFERVLFRSTRFEDWTGVGANYIKLNAGMYDSFAYQIGDVNPTSSQSVFDLDVNTDFGDCLILGNRYNGVGEFFKSGGLDQTDPLVIAATNPNVPDSGVFGTAFFFNNATETVISATNTPVPISGTTAPGPLERMTHSSPNLTYIGREPVVLRVEAHVTIQVTAELETDDLHVYIYVDGVQFPATVASKTLGTVFQDPTVDYLASGDVPAITGQVIEARIENKSSTTNILVSEFRLLVRK